MVIRFLILFIIFSYTYSYGENKCISCHNDNICMEKGNNCTVCHRGNDKTTRLDIAHYKLIKGDYAEFNNEKSIITQKGIQLINDANCTRCHKIGNTGANYATDLNSTVKRLSTDEIIKSIQEPVINMPKFKFSKEDYRYLITGLYHYTINAEVKSITQVVRLNNKDNATALFNNKCGGCHKALTNIGALGYYDSAPNLSSLKNSYPDYLNGKSWNKDNLKKWLLNPRSIKKNATMPKIELNEEESKKIIDLLLQ